MTAGICAGALLQRTLPALAATLAAFIAVRFVVAELIRPHYLAAVTTLYGMGSASHPAGAYWPLGQGFTGPHGPLAIPQSTNEAVIDGVPRSLLSGACPAPVKSGDQDALSRCLDAAGFHHFITYQFITYQPAGRYWAFQSVEFGIFAALAAALLAVTFAVVRRRDA